MPGTTPPPYTVLVVEDEPGIRDSLQLLLELEGYDVVTAADGRQALDMLERFTCHLLLTDHMMPILDGMALLRRLREDARYAGLPAIMMSAAPRPPDLLPELAGLFISKPFEIPRLLAALDALTGRRASDA